MHRGKTFVISCSGEVVDSPAFRHIVHDIALLNTLGIRLILVHGARPQVEERLALRNITTRLHNNLRITDHQTIQAVTDAAGHLRCQIEAMLSLGLPDSPMQGASIRVASGNFVTAKPIGIRDGIDFLYTGCVRRIDTESIGRLLDDDCIILIPPIGYSPTGEVFNMAAVELATQTAIAVNADKLIFLDDMHDIVDDGGQLIAQLSTQEAEQLRSLSTLCDEQKNIIDAAIRASRHGIERVHMISSRVDGTLLRELFIRDGCGTLIYADYYDTLRAADINDVGGILNLIQPLEEQGVLVRRSREHLETEIEQFIVIERDGMVIGCAALYDYPDEAMAELACVVVHPDYRGGDRGEQLLNKVVECAKQRTISRLFVLTTQTAHWFIEQGFLPGDADDLPQQKQQLYNYQRNSKVFVRNL